MKKKIGVRFKLISIASIILFFMIWELVTDVFEIVPSTMLPSPIRVVETLGEKWTDQSPDGSTLPQHIIASLQVSGMGFCLGMVFGIPLGVIMAWWKRADYALSPVFDFVRTIPPIAWIPIMIVMLGIGLLGKASIVFLSAFIPCVISSYTGIKATKNVHIWVAQTFGASHLRILFKVALPTALPYIFTGLKVSMNSARASLVAAEMLGSASGLGYMIQMGRLLSRADLIVAGMVVIGIIGTILSAILDLLERIMVKGEVQ